MKKIPVSQRSTATTLAISLGFMSLSAHADVNTAEEQKIGQAKCIWWSESNFTGNSNQMVTSDSDYSSVGDAYSARVRMINNEGEAKQAQMTLFDPWGAHEILTTEAVVGGDEIKQDALIGWVTNNISCKVL